MDAWQLTACAARNRVRVILSAEHGNPSIGYADDLCDAQFVRLRRIAPGMAQQRRPPRCTGRWMPVCSPLRSSRAPAAALLQHRPCLNLSPICVAFPPRVDTPETSVSGVLISTFQLQFLTQHRRPTATSFALCSLESV